MKSNKPELAPGFMTADQVIRMQMSTGITAINELLGGGLENSITHLFYGNRSLHNDMLKIAVYAQVPKERGGLGSPTVIIDSANMLKIEKLTDYSFEFELEPEEVMDNIYITRAFNSSQTYDIVMNQLEGFFERVPAQLLLVTGLPDLYIEEGMTGEAAQQLTHMATRLMTFTLQRNLVTIITAPVSEQSKHTPAGGKALASCAQVHVHFEEHKSYSGYTLAKHPNLPVRRTSRSKPKIFGKTLPLSHFLNQEGTDE
jgi:RecA/RadA recombinase